MITQEPSEQPDLAELGRNQATVGLHNRTRYIAAQVLNYVTNHVVSRIPVFRLRLAWYRRAIGLTIGDGSVVFLGCYVWFYGRRTVGRSQIGCNTIINRDCCLDVRGPLRIGDNVSISPGVAILTTQHQIGSPRFDLETREVVIEDHAWIGMRAIVLPGAHIGRGAVVAAGAVVSGKVAPMTIVGGVPAKPIGTRPAGADSYVFTAPPPLFE
jgi:acetyltransferase-like isoleucine patch superfamily enzyme